VHDLVVPEDITPCLGCLGHNSIGQPHCLRRLDIKLAGHFNAWKLPLKRIQNGLRILAIGCRIDDHRIFGHWNAARQNAQRSAKAPNS
jgi:hypothetical protein